MKVLQNVSMKVRWIGGILALAALLSIWLVDWRPGPPPEPEPVRPLKTIVMGADFIADGKKYPGKVHAGQEVEMSFEVAGKIVKKNVKKGQTVKKGEVLFELDARDYQNDVQAARAELNRARAQFERIKEAAAVDAVSKQDVTNAQAAYDSAEATLKTKQKALDETKLVARFGGVIANVYADNFQNVQAKEPILSLQDVSGIEVRVDIPEQRMARARREERGFYRFVAILDYFPGREFPIELTEIQTEADPVTQTYQATFTMRPPKDVTILPGMTVSVVEYIKDPEKSTQTQALIAPLDAVPVGENGEYYVWMVEPTDGTEYVVRKRPVKVGPVTGGMVEITSGLASGDRIAAAGVHLLKEGQHVLLLNQ